MAVRYADKGPSASHAIYFKPKASRFKPPAAKPDSFLLWARVAGSHLLWGGRGMAVRQKVTGASQIPKK
jgi:hypothetical protein